MSETRDQGLRVTRLEFGELGSIDDARNEFANIKRDSCLARHDAVNLFGRVGGLAWFDQGQRHRLASIQIADQIAGNGQRMAVIFGEMIGHT